MVWRRVADGRVAKDRPRPQRNILIQLLHLAHEKVAQTALLVFVVLQLGKVYSVVELCKFMLTSKFYSIESLRIVTELFLNLALLKFINLALNHSEVHAWLTYGAL